MIHILLACLSCHLQAYPSGSWMLLLLAKPTSQEHISLSNNLWWENNGSFSISPSADNWINHTFTGLLDYNIQAVTYQLLSCPPRDATNLSQLHYKRGWVTRNSLISLPLASVSSDKGQQSLSPGTLVLLAGPVGLMVTQATEFNKNKVWIAERCWSRLISKPNTSSVVIRYKIPGWPNVGTHQSTLEGINLAL